MLSREIIDQFIDDYSFLSNYYRVPVTFEGIHYLNNEAAFQAQKTLDIEVRKQYSSLSPQMAKEKGRGERLRPDWEEVKFDVMKQICIAKFEQHPDLKEKLLATGNKILIEGNTWNDTCWGIDIKTGKGQNHLGQILMEIRDEFRKKPSLTKSIPINIPCNIVSEENPNLALDVTRGSTDQGAYLMLWTLTGHDNQKFLIQEDGHIIVYHSKLALDIGSKKGGVQNIIQYSKNDNPTQKWTFNPDGSICSEIGLCMDISRGKIEKGTKVIAWEPNNRINQKWRIIPLSDPPRIEEAEEEKKYGKKLISKFKSDDRSSSLTKSVPINIPCNIVSEGNPNLGLDISKGSTEKGAYLMLWTLTGRDNQKFLIQEDGHIITYQSRLALDVGIGKGGQSIIQYSKNDNPNQKWTFNPDGSICSEIGFGMDISRGKIEKGTKVIAWEPTHRINQKWRIIPLSDAPQKTMDVMFVIDATGSMDPTIKAAQSRASQIAVDLRIKEKQDKTG